MKKAKYVLGVLACGMMYSSNADVRFYSSDDPNAQPIATWKKGRFIEANRRIGTLDDEEETRSVVRIEIDKEVITDEINSYLGACVNLRELIIRKSSGLNKLRIPMVSSSLYSLESSTHAGLIKGELASGNSSSIPNKMLNKLVLVGMPQSEIEKIPSDITAGSVVLKDYDNSFFLSGALWENATEIELNNIKWVVLGATSGDTHSQGLKKWKVQTLKVIEGKNGTGLGYKDQWHVASGANNWIPIAGFRELQNIEYVPGASRNPRLHIFNCDQLTSITVKDHTGQNIEFGDHKGYVGGIIFGSHRNAGDKYPKTSKSIDKAYTSGEASDGYKKDEHASLRLSLALVDAYAKQQRKYGNIKASYITYYNPQGERTDYFNDSIKIKE